MIKVIFFILTLISSPNIYSMEIVTIDHDTTHCLNSKAGVIPITQEGLEQASKIVKQLEETLIPYMPAAGLAAPQIGISKQVFIYSWDRTTQNLEAVINPSFTPIGDEMVASWEVCFSTMLKNGKVHAAFLKRYKKITVTYTDLEGKTHHKILEDFAAKVFQHEYDHLQGIVCVRKKDAELNHNQLQLVVVESKKNHF